MVEARYVLIVDDDADAREILSTTLRALGFETASAGDGVEALASIQQRTPDLVLLDLLMPRMNGFQLLRRLREIPEMDRVPVIIISALRRDELSDLPGVAHVLQKTTYSVTDLQTSIMKVLVEVDADTDTDTPAESPD